MLDRNQTFMNVQLALALGYELIDTAAIYNNEAEVSLASVRAHVNPIVITKVWPTELGFRRTYRSVLASRKRLNQAILDVVLLHWPRCYWEWNVDWMDCSNAENDDESDLWLKSWDAFEKLYAEGLVLSIGVSNFDVNMLKQAMDKSVSVEPMIVQNYFSLKHLDEDVITFCRKNWVLYHGYSLLREGITYKEKDVLRELSGTEDFLSSLFHLLLKSRIGFLIRSTNPSHIKDNIMRIENTLELKSEVDALEFLRPNQKL